MTGSDELPRPEGTEPGVATFEGKARGPSARHVVALAGIPAALLVGAAVALGGQATPSQRSTPLDALATIAEPAAVGRSTGWTAPAGLDLGDGFLGRDGIGRHGFREITITAISGSNLSLETEDGWTRTITVTDDTTVTKAGQEIGVAELAVGDQVVLRQTRNDDGSYSIDTIAVVVPTVAGTVTAVDADSITIDARGGTDWTITTTSETVYQLGSETGSRSDVVVGATIVAAGEQGSEATLTAETVRIQVPRVAGEVTAKSDSTLTIEQRDGTTLTIHVDADTEYAVRGVEDAGLDDVDVGIVVVALGTQNEDGSIDAQQVHAGVGFRFGGPGLGGRGWGGPFGPDRPDATDPDASPSPGDESTTS
jgi:hypothetical protein